MADHHEDLESVVLEIHALSHGPEFLPGLLRALRRLVASPYALYGLSDLSNGFTCTGIRYPETIDLERWLPVFDAHFWEHPVHHRAEEFGVGQVATLPSLVGGAPWAATANCAEFCRPNGIENQLWLRLPSVSGVMEVIGLGRPDRDFSDDECARFEALADHVLVAHRRAQLLAQHDLPVMSEPFGLTTAHLVLTREGDLQFAGYGAMELLWQFFSAGGAGQTRSLPDEVQAWVRAQIAALPGSPPAELWCEAEIDAEPRRLRCWLVINQGRGDFDVYLQARPVQDAAILRPRPQARGRSVVASVDVGVQMEVVNARWQLRVRQRAVLGLLVRGCSNKEIARQLGCVEATVEYHVTGLLRATDSANRASLVTKFWNER